MVTNEGLSSTFSEGNSDRHTSEEGRKRYDNGVKDEVISKY